MKLKLYIDVDTDRPDHIVIGSPDTTLQPDPVRDFSVILDAAVLMIHTLNANKIMSIPESLRSAIKALELGAFDAKFDHYKNL